MLSLVGSFIRQPQSCFIPERWAEIPIRAQFPGVPKHRGARHASVTLRERMASPLEKEGRRTAHCRLAV